MAISAGGTEAEARQQVMNREVWSAEGGQVGSTTTTAGVEEAVGVGGGGGGSLEEPCEAPAATGTTDQT